jgi:hypothetical protein
VPPKAMFTFSQTKQEKEHVPKVAPRIPPIKQGNETKYLFTLNNPAPNFHAHLLPTPSGSGGREERDWWFYRQKKYGKER